MREPYRVDPDVPVATRYVRRRGRHGRHSTHARRSTHRRVGPDAGHDRHHRPRSGPAGARRPAGDVDRVDEDAPCDRGRRERHHRSDPGVGRPDGEPRRRGRHHPAGRGRGTRPRLPAMQVDLDRVRPDLAETIARHQIGLDAARPDAVERRRKVGRRTARENVADLVDEGSFVEYGALVIAAQRRRRSLDDLIARTPADGMIGGIGRVNGRPVPGSRRAVHRGVVRLHGARRNAGRAEPSQEGQAVRRRRRDAACRSCSSPKAGEDARATPTPSASAGSIAGRSTTSPGSAARCRSSASMPATASPATRRSWDAATWSSRPRTRTSAWADRR